MLATKTREEEGLPTLTRNRFGVMAANLRRLADVMLSEEYDGTFLRPTNDALQRAWELLVSAEEAVSSGLPPAFPAPVGDGGILLQWDSDERTVFLAVPANPGEGYIYLRAPGYRRTLRELNGEALPSSLAWLCAQ